jgi:hypothetical protein
MRNRHILRRLSKKHARVVQKIMPLMTIGGALLSLVASSYAAKDSLSALNASPWDLYASVFGMTTAVFSLCYGAYCAREVYHAVQRGDEGRALGGVSLYMHEWYYGVDKKGQRAALASDALIEHDFLEHISHLSHEQQRTEKRRQLAAAVEQLEVDASDVDWPEDRPFAVIVCVLTLHLLATVLC